MEYTLRAQLANMKKKTSSDTPMKACNLNPVQVCYILMQLNSFYMQVQKFKKYIQAMFIFCCTENVWHHIISEFCASLHG